MCMKEHEKKMKVSRETKQVQYERKSGISHNPYRRLSNS